MKKLLLLGMSCLVGACGQAPTPTPTMEFSRFTAFDLSHPFNERTIYWPTSEPFELQKGPEGITPGGYFYNANTYRASEHGGTHLDAPYHFYEGRRKVGEIPLDQLLGDAVVIDVRGACRDEPDYLVRPEDFHQWESSNGRLPENGIVLIQTGYSRYWPDAERYLGTAERGEQAASQLHFPGLSPEAAHWLSRERRIKAVGIDTASIDRGQSADFESHVALASENILIFENLTGLDQLPPRGFSVIALPMKIEEGSGAPLRAVALVPKT